MNSLHHERENFRRDVLDGLSGDEKSLPCKWFYDARGSQLFDEICELPEYYPTRVETRIMEANGAEMAELLGENLILIEPGAGSSLKTRILLRHLRAPSAYFPIDISREHLEASAADLGRDFPSLLICPVVADYTQRVDLPLDDTDKPRAIYFPGSTIGNFWPDEAVSFLQKMRAVASTLLIGVDTRKDPAILRAAYNDSAGVTAQFNLHLLERINAELGGDFDLPNWRHRAIWNDGASRIEMQLVSQNAQNVRIAGQNFDFAVDEVITTEHCHKYSPASFEALAKRANWRVEQVWSDADSLFSVQLLRG
ncbi:MAG TPA: L-histidine N(alpha)-methyltransferase [Abditibacterium sp.]|jgi:dimethylhistidine N-methyltransferase